MAIRGVSRGRNLTPQKCSVIESDEDGGPGCPGYKHRGLAFRGRGHQAFFWACPTFAPNRQKTKSDTHEKIPFYPRARLGAARSAARDGPADHPSSHAPVQ